MTTPTTRAAPALPVDRVSDYLARIGHAPVRGPSPEALASLQDAHVRSVPFENLDIHLGCPLALDIDALAAKVIDRRRGGFCYELNGLFCALLVALGFDAWLVEARTREENGGLGPRFDHVRILVATGGATLLVDVGTGASPRRPIRLDERPQLIGPTWYRVRTRGRRYDSEQLDGDTWMPDWSFDTRPRALTDFADRTHFHQHSPDSHFTHKPICTLVTETGHVTLADGQLITTSAGRRVEQQVDEPLAVLAERFGIRISRWPDARPPTRSTTAT